MAELGIAASLVGVASAAISLTKTLYDFGSTASSAKDHVDRIAKNVSFYGDVLELLIEQFEDDRPIHSKKATKLIEKIHDHSYDLFDHIRSLIPRDRMSFVQKLAWNFKKTKVDLLVGELENLKSTVNLIAQVLSTARLRYYYKGTGGKSSDGKKQQKKQREAAARQYSRAKNGIVEWQLTQETLPILQEAAERDDLRSSKTVSELTLGSPAPSKYNSALIKNSETTLAAIESATASATGADSRAVVLGNTANWLEQLIEEWTVVLQEPVEKPQERKGSGPTNSKRGSANSFVESQDLDKKERVQDGTSPDGHKARDQTSVEILEARIRLQEMELQEERRQRKLAEQEKEFLLGQNPVPGPSRSDSRMPEALYPDEIPQNHQSEIPQLSQSQPVPSSKSNHNVAKGRSSTSEIPDRSADLKRAGKRDFGYADSSGQTAQANSPNSGRRAPSRYQYVADHGSDDLSVFFDEEDEHFYHRYADRDSVGAQLQDKWKEAPCSDADDTKTCFAGEPMPKPRRDEKFAGVLVYDWNWDREHSGSLEKVLDVAHKERHPTHAENCVCGSHGSSGGQAHRTNSSPRKSTRYQIVEDDEVLGPYKPSADEYGPYSGTRASATTREQDRRERPPRRPKVVEKSRQAYVEDESDLDSTAAVDGRPTYHL